LQLTCGGGGSATWTFTPDDPVTDTRAGKNNSGPHRF
jgi:hypothetical protein